MPTFLQIPHICIYVYHVYVYIYIYIFIWLVEFVVFKNHGSRLSWLIFIRDMTYWIRGVLFSARVCVWAYVFMGIYREQSLLKRKHIEYVCACGQMHTYWQITNVNVCISLSDSFETYMLIWLVANVNVCVQQMWMYVSPYMTRCIGGFLQELYVRVLVCIHGNTCINGTIITI